MLVSDCSDRHFLRALVAITAPTPTPTQTCSCTERKRTIHNYLSRNALSKKIRAYESSKTRSTHWTIKINSFQTFCMFKNFHVLWELQRQNDVPLWGWNVKHHYFFHRSHRRWKIAYKCNRSLVEIPDSIQIRNQPESIDLTKLLPYFPLRSLELTCDSLFIPQSLFTIANSQIQI